VKRALMLTGVTLAWVVVGGCLTAAVARAIAADPIAGLLFVNVAIATTAALDFTWRRQDRLRAAGGSGRDPIRQPDTEEPA
jgi:hypothetical protein